MHRERRESDQGPTSVLGPHNQKQMPSGLWVDGRLSSRTYHVHGFRGLADPREPRLVKEGACEQYSLGEVPRDALVPCSVGAGFWERLAPHTAGLRLPLEWNS